MKLTPPAVIQRGRKDRQYFPRQATAGDGLAYLLDKVMRAGGVLEYDPVKLDTSSKTAIENNLKIVVWQPVAKDNLGDVVFDGFGAGQPAPGPYYVQVIEGPKAESEDGKVIEMPFH